MQTCLHIAESRQRKTKSKGRMKSNLYNDGGAAAGDHDHGVALSDGFVVDVNAYDGIGAEGFRAFTHFFQCCLFGFDEHFLVAAAASAEDVADAGHEVFKEVCTDDDFTGDDAAIVVNGAAFNGGCGCDKHNVDFVFLCRDSAMCKQVCIALAAPSVVVLCVMDIRKFSVSVYFDAKLRKKVVRRKHKGIFFVILSYENRIGS